MGFGRTRLEACTMYVLTDVHLRHLHKNTQQT